MTGAALERWLGDRRRLVERTLRRLLPPRRSRLREAMRYSLLAGGKRLRPILTLAGGELAGAPSRVVLPFACALEYVHTYSLVHDDLPAMDDDDERRGRPTSHRVYGEGLAILVGDALLTEAFALMARAPGVSANRTLAAIDELARAAGEDGMVGGQALDLAAEGKAGSPAQVRRMHARKTGALFRAAVRVGAIVGGATPSVLRRLTVYGEQLGLAFQIVDDLLDLATPSAAGGDVARGKTTYPAVLGVARARRYAEQARDAAVDALRPLGPAADPLRGLAAWVVDQAQP